MSASPSVSPPRTPEIRNIQGKSRSTSTPTSDDSSIIEDLSFEYVQNDAGEYVRLSKGSSKSNVSSPPTPTESPLQPDQPVHLKPPSPSSLESPTGRGTLSRSESAFPVLLGSGANSERPARSFQRVASGPAISMTPSYAAPTAASKARPTTRRVTLEENRDRLDAAYSSLRTRQTLDSNANANTLQEEKENISESDEHPYALPVINKPQRYSPPLSSRSIASSRALPNRVTYSVSTSNIGPSSRPLADVPVPQRERPNPRQILPGPNRAGRIMKSAPLSKLGASASLPASSFDRPAETDSGDSDYNHGGDAHSPIGIAIGGDDTDLEDEPLSAVEPAAVPLPSSVPTSSHLSAGRQRSHVVSTATSGQEVLSRSGTRPRRSASLSDALAQDDYQMQVQQTYQGSSSRPGTSLGLNGQGDNTAGARRVTVEERDRAHQDMRAELKKQEELTSLKTEYENHVEEAKRREENLYQQQSVRQSPSPTGSQHPTRPAYGHKRRDSDTLRSFPMQTPVAFPSPTYSDIPNGKVSPLSARGRISPSTTKGRVSPPTSKGRLSPPISNRLGRDIGKHRRSPTAPEPPTTSGTISAEPSTSASGMGKTWAAGDRDDEYEYGASASERERERERERDREILRARERDRRSQQSHMSLPQQPVYAQTAPPAPAPTPAPAQLNRHIVVNKKAYARLDMIGKGGSSRVFRVLNHANELYAIKRVSLDKTDSETMSGYMNEIALLKRLEGNSRIIRLIDSEVKAGPGGSKGHLLLVMECGEIDLARLLQEQMKEPVNMVWVSYYWQQMLQAVHVIHEEKIVHSDLKPANFVLVRGQLKLIDFGIANAIANDTTNIQRDHQIGTVNYMSPEAIELPDGMRRLKVGRPSDVWSLGCILYQMVYGQPPFQHLSVYQKMKAIPDMAYAIEFPEYATPCVPSPRTSSGSAGGSHIIEPPKKLDHLKRKVRRDVIVSMKSCLIRGPKDRATIPELMEDDWLAMKEPEPPAVKDLLGDEEAVITPHFMRQLLEYGIKLCESPGVAKDQDSLMQIAHRLVAELKSVES